VEPLPEAHLRALLAARRGRGFNGKAVLGQLASQPRAVPVQAGGRPRRR
jgi:hypothetical protein